MWADVDTDLDFLNYSEVAELTVDLINDRNMRPLSIGVFGTWGTGKSTLLNLIERQLKPESGSASPYIVVRFDAWLYQGYDDARAALMEVIASDLIDAAESNDASEAQKAPLLAKAKKFLSRVNYFRAAGLLAEGGAALMGFPVFGTIAKGAGALEHIVSGEPVEGDVESLKKAEKQIQEEAKGLIKPEKKERRTPPAEIAAFRRELGEILTELDRTLVVFVDNLDRCLPKQTIHTLEALRLFLFMPSTAFVVAADEDMVRRSVGSFFTDLDDRHVTDYLDKLIQVPGLGVQEVRAYMFLLFAVAGGVKKDELEALRAGLETSLRQSWKDEPISRRDALKLLGDKATDEIVNGFEIAERIAPLLASSTQVKGNPRIVKRMLNVVRLRSRLARRRNMTLDEAQIAKLALFERCTDALATGELYKVIQEAAGGKPALLKDLEGLVEDPDKFQAGCPEAWKTKHVDFLREWMSLDPKFADVDLRPAAYLSRETQPLRARKGDLSAPAAEALRALLKATNAISPAAKSALATVSPPEHAAVMDAILSELRRAEDWKSKPSAFDGALILAEASPEAGATLASYIRGLFQDGKLPPWLKVLIKDAAWFKSGKGER